MDKRRGRVVRHETTRQPARDVLRGRRMPGVGARGVAGVGRGVRLGAGRPAVADGAGRTGPGIGGRRPLLIGIPAMEVFSWLTQNWFAQNDPSRSTKPISASRAASIRALASL